MHARTIFAPLLLSVALGSIPAWAEPSPDVTLREHSSGTYVAQARLPGHLRSWAALEVGSGPRQLMLLVAFGGRDGEQALFRFDPLGDGELEQLAPIPPEVDQLVAFGSGASDKEILLLRSESRLLTLDPTTPFPTPRQLLDLVRTPPEARQAGRQAPFRWLGLDGGWLSASGFDRLALFRHEGGEPQPVSVVALPVSARRRPGALRLTSAPFSRIDRPGTAPLFAIGPEPHGQRLRTVLVDPLAEAEARQWEAWCLFPANERVVTARYTLLDDQPVLLVATLSADKMGVFEKQKLRLFRLRDDRTRAGLRPSLEAKTASRLWQRTGLYVQDVDGDGNDDVVTTQEEGLSGEKLILEAYLGQGGGRFESRPKKTVVDAMGRRHYGEDLTGDGIADLAVLESWRFAVFAGIADRRGLLEKEPRWSIQHRASEDENSEDDEDDEDDPSVEIHVGTDGLHGQTLQSAQANGLGFEDLDGDGHAEVIAERHGEGSSELWVLRFPR